MKTLPIILLTSTVLLFNTANAQDDARPHEIAGGGPEFLQPGEWWNLYFDERNDALNRSIRAVKIVRLSSTHPSWVQIAFPRNRKEHGSSFEPVARAHDDEDVAFDAVIAEWEESITEWKSIWINLDFVVSMSPVEADKAHQQAAPNGSPGSGSPPGSPFGRRP